MAGAAVVENGMSNLGEVRSSGDRRCARAVEWLSVPALWRRTKGQVLGRLPHRDPRAAFASLDASVAPIPRAERATGDVWVDYVADVGDGYQATRAVALCQSRPQGDTVPGELLIFGGDEVYPAASPKMSSSPGTVSPWGRDWHSATARVAW